MNWTIQDVALPARLRPPAPLTDEELIAFSQANKPCRVERLASGEIVVMTPSGFENNRREAYLVHELFAWAEKDGRGIAFSSNAGFNLPDGSTFSPDAGWVEAARLAALTKEQRERYLPFAPDFVVEILSPTDSLAELDAKMGKWIANGARLGWRIDPFGGTIAVFASGSAPVVLDRPESVEGEGPVAGFHLPMAPLWATR
ncbi:MAG TPA: Uma2 family endonuclease [Terracidiphilus sp.]|nr:Uma2 family endonuclease [Terracidiphilus sp.]